MPIRYHIDGARRVLVAEVKGALFDDELLDYARSLVTDPQVKEADHELVDLRQVEAGSKITTEGVKRLGEFWRSMYDQIAGGKCAIIAEGDAAFGMARMYQLMRDDGPDQIRVFRSEAEAWAWLEEPDES